MKVYMYKLLFQSLQFLCPTLFTVTYGTYGYVLFTDYAPLFFDVTYRTYAYFATLLLLFFLVFFSLWPTGPIYIYIFFNWLNLFLLRPTGPMFMQMGCGYTFYRLCSISFECDLQDLWITCHFLITPLSCLLCTSFQWDLRTYGSLYKLL